MNAGDIFYSKGGERFGPVSRDELDRLIASGEIGPEDRVRAAPSMEWVTVADFYAGAETVRPLTPAPARRPPPKRSTTEIVILLVVMGGLAAIAVPSFGRARLRATASGVLHDMRNTDAAKDQYALETNKKGDVRPTWDDLRPYISLEHRPWMKDGNDLLGNPIIVGSISERLRVHPLSKQALLSATGGDTFWGPYS
jgi:type II secretory pathway pseudopilin PulG